MDVRTAVHLPTGAAFEMPPEVAPGVLAFVNPVADMLLIPFVWATSPGRGDVGRWLDGLPRDRRVVFVEVMNPRLAGMLERRGFLPGRMVFDGDTADVMFRNPDARR